MLKKPLFIDNLQYSNWSLEVFEQMREANLTAVHVTICYHENFRLTIENIISWNKFIELHPDLLMLARNADDTQLSPEKHALVILWLAWDSLSQQ